MKILFSVDRASALKLGVDWESSTVELDIDPTKFTERELNIIALAIGRDGYKATSMVMFKTGFDRIDLTTPDEAGLRRELAKMIKDEDFMEAALIEKLKMDQTVSALESEKCLAAIEEHMRKNPSRMHYVNIDGVVSWSDHESIGQALMPELCSYWCDDEKKLSVEALQKLKQIWQQIGEKRDAIKAMLIELAATKKAKYEEEQQQQLDHLLAEQTLLFRERHAAGFVSDTELVKVNSDAVLKRLGLVEDYLADRELWSVENSDNLTEQEYVNLLAFKARVPLQAKLLVFKRARIRPDEADERFDTELHTFAFASWRHATKFVSARCKLTL